jgi:UDP-N-acetylglucosamine diphosphorylase/glucosamine-1-phosphate N-acetyltransferase
MEIEEYRIVQSSRLVLQASPPSLPERGATLTVAGEVVGWLLPPGVPTPGLEEILLPRSRADLEHLEVEGYLLNAPWELMSRNGNQLRKDIPRYFPGFAADDIPGSHILGSGLLSLGKNVHVEPGCIFDLRDGPIRLADGVVVRSHTRLQGPAFVGPGSSLLGGSFSEISVGPVCKVRGEVECSLILGYSNKAHDGFLGHAYLGRWVNLGALTTNSDLKNNYGPVRVGTSEGPLDTGLMKVGCFLGDHVKTGIGTMLNTGTVVGTGSNVFGGEMPPTYVPPFSWGEGHELTEFRLDKFLEVARRAMGRRGVELDTGMEALLTLAFEATRAQRDTGSQPR